MKRQLILIFSVIVLFAIFSNSANAASSVQITNVYGAGTFSPGDSVQVTALIKNTGTNLLNLGLTFKLTHIDTQQTFVAPSFPVLNLHPGYTREERYNFQITSNMPVGAYVVKAVIFDQSTFQVYDEKTSSSQINVGQSLDLVITNSDVILQNQPKAGEPLYFTIKVRNTGSVQSGSFTLRYKIVDANQNVVGDFNKAITISVPAGGYHQFTDSFGPISAGSYALKVVADEEDKVKESDEGNNEASNAFVVGVGETTNNNTETSQPPNFTIESTTPDFIYSQMVNVNLINDPSMTIMLKNNDTRYSRFDITTCVFGFGLLGERSYVWCAPTQNQEILPNTAWTMSWPLESIARPTSIKPFLITIKAAPSSDPLKIQKTMDIFLWRPPNPFRDNSLLDNETILAAMMGTVDIIDSPGDNLIDSNSVEFQRFTEAFRKSKQEGTTVPTLEMLLLKPKTGHLDYIDRDTGDSAIFLLCSDPIETILGIGELCEVHEKVQNFKEGVWAITMEEPPQQLDLDLHINTKLGTDPQINNSWYSGDIVGKRETAIFPDSITEFDAVIDGKEAIKQIEEFNLTIIHVTNTGEVNIFSNKNYSIQKGEIKTIPFKLPTIDLSISADDISFSGTYTEKDVMSASANIHNLDEDTNATVSVYDNGVLVGENDFLIPAQGTKAELIKFIPTLGRHTITVKVDPYNQVEEKNEGNNEIARTIEIKAAGLCTQKDPSLVSLWTGDGATDDMVGSNHGVIDGGNLNYVDGKIGQAFSLGGARPFVRIPNSPSLNPSSSFTVDAWIFPTEDRWGNIISKWGDENEWAGQRSYVLHTAPGGRIEFDISDDSYQNSWGFHHDLSTSPFGSITLNQWNHVAGVYDQPGGMRKIYINGQKVSVASHGAIKVYPGIADVTIGSQLQSPSLARFYFAGRIDEAEFYNKALSDAEIQSIYSQGTTGSGERCLPKKNQNIDLAIADGDISFSSPAPAEGDLVQIRAVVRNLGAQEATPKITFYDEMTTGRRLIGSKTLPIGAGASTGYFLTWNFSAGGHTVYVMVDEDNLISETNEGNNNAKIGLTVSEKPQTPPDNYTGQPGNGNLSEGGADTVAPNVSIISPQNKQYDNYAEQLKFEYSVADDKDAFPYVTTELDGKEIIAKEADLKYIGAGSHTFKVTAIDSAANKNSAEVQFSVVDKVPPTVQIVSPEGAYSYLGGNADILFLADDNVDSLLNYNVLLDDVTYSSPAIDLNSISLGPHKVSVTATDQSGNTGVTFSLFNVTDNVPPISAIDISALNGENDWYTSVASIKLSANDAKSGIKAIEYSIDRSQPYYEYSEPFKVLNDGFALISYRSTDNAGNVEAFNSALLKVDTAAPETLSDAPDGWQKGDFTVFLSASDKTSGVQKVLYCVDKTNTCAPETEGVFVPITEEGISYARYYAVDNAGNTEPVNSNKVKLDKTPPTTTADAPAAWVNHDVTVKLAATDELSGVGSAYYSLNSAVFAEGKEISLSNEGINKVAYYSVDNASNKEAEKQFTVKIDKTASELLIRFNTTTRDIDVVGIDNLDETVAVSYTSIEKGRVYNLIDDAGNSVILKMKYEPNPPKDDDDEEDKDDKDSDKIKVVLEKITYNGAEYNFPKNNKFKFYYKYKDSELTRLKQELKQKSKAAYDFEVKATYKNGETKIKIKEEGADKTDTTEPKLVLVEARTKSGELKWGLA